MRIEFGPVAGVPGVWRASKVERTGWSLVAVVIADGDGLVVYGPVKGLGDAIHARIVELGRPRLLVAPNHFHHLGVPEWSARYPEAVAVGSDGALPRLRRQQAGVAWRGLDEVAWPAGLGRLEAVGTRNGELWLRPDARSWIVGDAFMNLAPPLSGAKGMLLRLAVGPGLRIARTWGPLHLGDRGVYRSWLRSELVASPPDRIVPLHGEVLDVDVAGRLGAVAETSL